MSQERPRSQGELHPFAKDCPPPARSGANNSRAPRIPRALARLSAFFRSPFPQASTIVLLAGGLLIAGQVFGMYSRTVGVAAVAATSIVVLGIVCWCTARSLRRAERARVLAEQSLQRAFAELESRVGERTSALVHANQTLEMQVIERKRTEEELLQANAVLTGWLKDLERRNQETTLLHEMSDLLQTSVVAEEAYAIVARFAQQLFPDESGALCVLNASQNLVEAVALWGDTTTGERVFAPHECWALRRGQVHMVEDSAPGLHCRHLGEPVPVSLVCVPMMAQGEALGVLYLRSGTRAAGSAEGPAEARLKENTRRLAVTAAGHIGLALANLRLRETLRLQSIRDPLTGLFNRRYMEESLARELRRAARGDCRLGAIMLDLDHFKHFNDTFGHEAGDALLRELGHFLRTRTRREDIACRYGGEEFALILPDACIEATRQRAELLREEFKRLTVQLRGESVEGLTLSLGVAVFPEHGSTVEEILRAADRALYCAKAEGRDRVVLGETIEQAFRLETD